MVVNPARLQMIILMNVSFWNWKRLKKNGIFKINNRKKIAPPTTHKTALLGVAIILNILSVHERLVNINRQRGVKLFVISSKSNRFVQSEDQRRAQKTDEKYQRDFLHLDYHQFLRLFKRSRMIIITPITISAWIIGEVTWKAKNPSTQRTISIIPMINNNLFIALNFNVNVHFFDY